MIAKKMKQCADCEKGKLSYLWKSNPPLCRFHHASRQSKVSKEKGKDMLNEYNKFCKQVWDDRNHVSELSGQRLPEHNPHSKKFHNLIRYHIHHIKEKARYPELMMEAENVILITFDEHQIIHFGSDKQRSEIGYDKFLKQRKTYSTV